MAVGWRPTFITSVSKQFAVGMMQALIGRSLEVVILRQFPREIS